MFQRCRGALPKASSLPPAMLYYYYNRGGGRRAHARDCAIAHPAMAAPTEGEGVGKLEQRKERIRREEKNLLIGKLMKEKANELCSEQKNVFNQCCKDAGLLMAFKCRKESKALQSCLASYYSDPEFNKQFDTEYLKKKEEFLKGVSPEKQQKSSKS